MHGEHKIPTETEKKQFFEVITNLRKEKSLTTLEAILHHCEETNLEINVVASLLNSTLKTELENDAFTLKLLKKAIDKKK
jgi:Phage late-transcription coactivator